MEEEILKNRYEFSSDGKAIIDVTVGAIGDLFNSFDKRAVYTRRELDQDFVEYITDCVKELGTVDFEIMINIENEFNIMQENTLRKAVKNHFSYLFSIEHKKIRLEFKKFVFLFVLGVFLGVLVYKMDISENDAVDLWVGIFSEGIIVAMWVAFWEAISSLIFGFRPYYSNRKMYHRIVNADLKVYNSVSVISLPSYAK
ncbi:MAG: hypothetical protein PHF29_07145 [Candidatus Riflebacteria bacterium]|nr:hypothetical protein [Candidatus Riflebacteria bacterium]